MTDERSGEQTELLTQILNELRDMNGRLARVDERSSQNEQSVKKLREERIVPVEAQVGRNENRSRRNELVLTAGVSLATMILAGFLTVGFNLI